MMMTQLEENPPLDEGGFEPLHEEESTKKGKKKRDSTSLRKAPQGKSWVGSFFNSPTVQIAELNIGSSPKKV